MAKNLCQKDRPETKHCDRLSDAFSLKFRSRFPSSTRQLCLCIQVFFSKSNQIISLFTLTSLADHIFLRCHLEIITKQILINT